MNGTSETGRGEILFILCLFYVYFIFVFEVFRPILAVPIREIVMNYMIILDYSNVPELLISKRINYLLYCIYIYIEYA